MMNVSLLSRHRSTITPMGRRVHDVVHIRRLLHGSKKTSHPTQTWQFNSTAPGEYAANATDASVCRLSPLTQLQPHEVTHVFGYPRNLLQKYSLGKTIGAGSFGVVKICVEITTGHRYAVKTIPKVTKDAPATPRGLIRLRSEVEIMQQLGYSLDAVYLKDVFEDDESIHLVMELCEGGSLLERIEAERHSEKYIVNIVRGILRFVSQCHAKGFIYRDVKPENFLFMSADPDSPLKATDFGLSIKYRHGEPKLKSRTGTPTYMAPELLAQSYDEKCDIWSVGMLTYQLLTGRFPFWEDVCEVPLQDMLKAIVHEPINWEAEDLKQVSGPAVCFLKNLLERDPEKRPSASEALMHPWLAEDDVEGAPDMPLGGSVVQRLQRFSTYAALKQLVLRMIMDDMASESAAKSGATSVDGRPALTQVLEPQDGMSVIPVAVAVDLQELFDTMDRDGSGDISLEELSIGLHKQGYVLSDGEIAKLMRRADTDQDGHVAYEEFMATMIDWSRVQSSKHWQGYVQSAFEKLDADGSGYISVDELITHLRPAKQRKRDRVSEPEDLLVTAKQMVRQVDTDGDGQISMDEFSALLNQEEPHSDHLCCYDDRLNQYFSSPPSEDAQLARASAAASKYSNPGPEVVQKLESLLYSVFRPQV